MPPISFWSRSRAASLGALLALALGTPVAAQPPVPAAPPPAVVAPVAPSAPVAAAPFAYTDSVRGTDGKIRALQTAIRRFDPVSGDGPTVYLVAATHIGEKAYYGKLQEFLNKQDVVLCEGVKPSRRAIAAAPAPAGKKSAPSAASAKGKPVPAQDFTSMQQNLAKTLNLYFQMQAIDYRQPNFRNSDLSLDDLTQLAKAQGTTTSAGLSDFISSLGGGGTNGKMMTGVLTQAKSNPAFAKMFRNMLVEILASPDRMAALIKQQGAADTKLDMILVAARNKAVLADLKSLKGTETKPLHSVALFYGAGHMQDLETHLVADMGYRAGGADWLTAITATP